MPSCAARCQILGTHRHRARRSLHDKPPCVLRFLETCPLKQPHQLSLQISDTQNMVTLSPMSEALVIFMLWHGPLLLIMRSIASIGKVRDATANADHLAQ
eukprot:5374687-Amphidinium_carterae.1